MNTDRAGSAMNPTTRVVSVMPSCAPESWKDRVRTAASTRPAPASPSRAAVSSELRSTATRLNSAAT